MTTSTLGTINIVGTILIFAGCFAIIAGIVVLISSVFSRQTQELQKQATRLSEKGFTDEISGALGNASFLIKELNSLVMTGRGIGMALILVGIFLTIGSFIILTQLP